mmetsp:Transcript_7630/g.9496  ORF Transcript_7630/g.9496 Transcript_7630/m.9496 type:complete len:92 (-) Transcript_7630:379-654(-)
MSHIFYTICVNRLCVHQAPRKYYSFLSYRFFFFPRLSRPFIWFGFFLPKPTTISGDLLIFIPKFCVISSPNALETFFLLRDAFCFHIPIFN